MTTMATGATRAIARGVSAAAIILFAAAVPYSAAADHSTDAAVVIDAAQWWQLAAQAKAHLGTSHSADTATLLEQVRVRAVSKTGDPLLREYQLHRLLQALASHPEPAGGRALINSLLDEPVIAKHALPDAGRDILVAAFPVATTARATLAAWTREALAQDMLAQLQDGLALTATPAGNPHTADIHEALLADAAVLAISRLSASSIPKQRTVEFDPAAQWPARVYRAAAQHSRAVDDYLRWVTAATRPSTPASEIQAGLRAALSQLTTADALQVFEALNTPLALDAMASLARARPGHATHPHIQRALEQHLRSGAYPVDAAVALGSLGDTSVGVLVETATNTAHSRHVRSAALIGLWRNAQFDTLRMLADDPSLPASMRQHIRLWLQP